MNETGTTKADEASHADWLELFFDLVFVAALALLNNFVLASPTSTFLAQSAVATAALLTIWLTVTLMNNWYPADDAWRRGAVLVVMVGLMLAALSVDPVVGLGYHVGQLGFAAALVALSTMFIRTLGDPGVPRASTYVAVGLSWVGVALCLVAANIDATPEIEYLFVAITSVMLLVPLNALYLEHRLRGHLIRGRHLTERLGQLALITLGEGFTLLAVNMQQPDAEPDLRLFLLTFVLAFLLWRLFFDGVLRGRKSFKHWRVAIVGQYLLLLGIVWLFDIMTTLSAFTDDELTRWDSVQFAFAATITFIGFALLTFARNARLDSRIWLHLALAAANLGLVVAVIILGAGLRVTAVVSTLLVAFDSIFSVRMSARREQAESSD